ncbi:MAG: mechanosensitive ion channel family protein [Chloroflexaceae bacterium]|nr:mechanosensitive ion channel family protein [Chloroflexaceae bacterium]
MEQLINTVLRSLSEVVASTVKVIPALLVALIIVFLTRYAAQFVQNLVISATKHTLRSESLKLLAVKSGHICTWVAGVILAGVVAFPGLELGDVIATLGLGSVAIGFAFQDIFKNFLAGILLLIQEPFRIGDQIIVNDYEGTVERVDIRTTKIRTYQGERVLIPNSTIFTSAVQVRTAFDARRTDLGVGVDYNTPLPQAQSLLWRTIAGTEGVLSDPTPEIDLVNFGDSSIDFVVRYWTRPQQKQVRYVQTQAVLAIKQAFDAADINIPYPIRTVYYYDQEQFHEAHPTSTDSQPNHRQNR